MPFHGNSTPRRCRVPQIASSSSIMATDQWAVEAANHTSQWSDLCPRSRLTTRRIIWPLVVVASRQSTSVMEISEPHQGPNWFRLSGHLGRLWNRIASWLDTIRSNARMVEVCIQLCWILLLLIVRFWYHSGFIIHFLQMMIMIYCFLLS